MIYLYCVFFRKGDGDNTAVGKSQQLYKSVDLHGVQRPPTWSSNALLSRQVADALSDSQVFVVGDVVFVDWTSACVTIQTICAMTRLLILHDGCDSVQQVYAAAKTKNTYLFASQWQQETVDKESIYCCRTYLPITIYKIYTCVPKKLDSRNLEYIVQL